MMEVISKFFESIIDGVFAAAYEPAPVHVCVESNNYSNK